MKKQIVRLLLLALSCSAVFGSCKKDSKTDWVTDTEISTQSDDEHSFSNHVDAIANDVNTGIEAIGSLVTGKITSTLCDATVVFDSTATSRRITITYDGTTTCHPNFTRSGKVIMTIPFSVRWKDSAAVVTIAYDGVKIIRVKDGKYFTINGSHTVTNVKGGLLKDLSSLGSIVHKIESSGMKITFNDGTERSWQVAKKREFNYSGGVVISTRGLHSDGTRNDIAEWGINRKGRSFYRAITSPLVVRQDCDFRLVSGATLHSNPAFTATVTFGLDATGAATSCPGIGSSYYYKAVWTSVGGSSKTIIMPY
ncbi:MAG: hypothetical protein QM530_10035 [Phycisphaerales bacterium]|nr:hypothetical protein [Phycisphaerales bacterium]